MLFTSHNFIIFIILLFIIYYLIPKRLQWPVLLIASYTFYYFAGIRYLVYILFTTLSSYLITRKMDSLRGAQEAYLKERKDSLPREEKKAYKAQMKRKRFFWLKICLCLNFGILAILKYTDFAIYNINMVFNREMSFFQFTLPLGISFYTFQTMGYVIDVYREKYPVEKNLGKLALFISFFPQLIQGPISRFDDLKDTMFSEHHFDRERITFGITRILWGYFKKLVIADRLLIAVNTIVGNPDTYQGAYVLLGMFYYALELYSDFTGGIDITIGIAQVLGIRVKENFIRPYFSKSIVEYWRRWHISLGTWFKEYMFYPISVCKPMLNLSKACRTRLGENIGKRIPVYLATLVVWFTTGFWHGGKWNFIVWGLGNGIIILISQECAPLYEKFHNKYHIQHTFYYRLFQVIRTFWLMSFLRTFDCYRDVTTTFKMYGSVFSDLNLADVLGGGFMGLGLKVSDYIILLLSVTILLIISLIQRRGSVRVKLASKPILFRYAVYIILVFSILIFGAYGIGYDASQFIYSQF
ncbi:MBOAT family O-acyltransferase [Anaerocolumna sp. AGMB13025]|uniref:MBOAT family O-acyltransferase n=1 Tax=Anaerocolumna sp. AGMB13025 TaxID=3039116 RepID=UPI00241F2EBF|nr:MBOAT family O-acyltransferase [Anaerocolumna sp. AGMB13025]WFR57690.1 MBOAT family O-acyltransferase [Anaerocolumna sp. AGMB13025]